MDTDPWNAHIAGRQHQIRVSPSNSHFHNINLLGGDFWFLNRLRPWVHDGDRMVTYYIGEKKWSVHPKL